MNVGETQRKLSVWAERDKECRFYDLYHLLYDKDWIKLAHDYVAQNAGSVTAGCDGINMRDFDKHLEQNLESLGEELKTETFEPYPVRRVYIPKSERKWRPLGIPSIRDRIVQEATRMILEPIYEADFSPHSFGFRPNRCTMDAIRAMLNYTSNRLKYFWIVEGDIASYFDTIKHKKLLKLLEKRVKDKKLLNLIEKFLRAGVMEGKTFRDTKMGTPQGGIISPLLANIYLHELDRYMEERTLKIPQYSKWKRRREGLGNFAYIRYADDFVVLCNGRKQQAEDMKEELYHFLAQKLRIELSKEKTKITHINEGFKFLGFWIQRMPGQKGMVTKVLIPKEAVANVKDKIAAATDPARHKDSVNTTILALNRIIGGWCRYYQYTGKAATTFQKKVRPYVFWQMAHWLGRKFQIPIPEVMRRYRQGNTFATEERRLTDTSEFKTRRYNKCYRKNPYTTQEKIQREDLPTETYWTGHEARPGMADLEPYILKRDEYTCQICKTRKNAKDLTVDHIRPVRRFKLAVNANRPENLWAVCKKCHVSKTEYDRLMESRMRGNLHVRFGGEDGKRAAR